MKLYATTTSERASKGQGGNEYLRILIIDENKQKQFCVNIDNVNGIFMLALFDYTTKRNVFVRELKGKSQKGECNAKEWSKTCTGCEFCKRTIEQD